MSHLSNIEGIPMEGKLPEVRLANTPFEVHAPYQPAGDQPQAIEALARGVEDGLRYQTLLGVTGSGKTFTMAKLIEAVQKPTLVMAPNKTLAAQLAAELKEFFPNNSVVYFVSYYDYYQPEAYVPSSDTFIEKDASINEEVEKLRHAATSALLSRRDCIVVASVSCIYGIGSPADYAGMAVFVDKQVPADRDQVVYGLIDIQYDRNDYELTRGTFRVRGDALDVFPPYADNPIRLEFWGDEIERIAEIDHVTGEVLGDFEALPIWPASHYVTARPKIDHALDTIQDELRDRLAQFKAEGKLLEAQRLEMRTNYDLEMLETMGFCSGIENYSRHLDGRAPGEPPYTLIDYFPKDFLCIIDESHVTVPQIRGMHEGDRSRKVTLAEHGFRLPSCLDNRPLRFDEFEARVPQFVYVSATPGDYEEKVSQAQVEQIIRPTGLLDPEIIVRPIASQIDDIIDEARERAERGDRVLITTLTKKMAEDLTDHLLDRGIRARYMHSDIGTLERVEILRDLRMGKFDVLVGINLLREGLDLPEVSLVAILDADKEGFLRNHRSLIQTIGRAARNVSGQVIMYADKQTDSMARAIDETRRRRALQMAYNEEHGIEPQTVRKAINDIMAYVTEDVRGASAEEVNKALAELSREEVSRIVSSMEDEMAAASANMDFEEAARLRDQVVKLRSTLEGTSEGDALARLRKKARKGNAARPARALACAALACVLAASGSVVSPMLGAGGAAVAPGAGAAVVPGGADLAHADELSDAQEAADQAQEAVDSAQQVLDSAEADMSRISSEYDALSGEVDRLQGEIDSTVTEVMAAQQAMIEGRQQLGETARYEYRSDSLSSALSLLFDAENFQDLLRNVEYIERIMDAQNEAIQEQQERKERFQEISERLGSQKDEQEEALTALDQKRVEAASVVSDANEKLSDATDAQGDAASRLAALQAQAASFAQQAAAGGAEIAENANTIDRADVVSSGTEVVANPDSSAPGASGGSSGGSSSGGSSSSGSGASSQGGWLTGVASAYGGSSDPYTPNPGTTATGAVCDDNSMGVAVPMSMANYRSYFGRTVEISYGGVTVYAVVNDCGSMGGGSRVLDLQPGVFKALGFSDCYAWGLRTVSYRFL